MDPKKEASIGQQYLPMHPSLDRSREHPKIVAYQGTTRILFICTIINQSTGSRAVLTGRDHGGVLEYSLVLSIPVISKYFACKHSHHSNLRLKANWAHSTLSLLWWL